MKLYRLMVCAATAALVAVPAAAQRVDRIVAFGDSYADDGNFFELTGIPIPPVYPRGRFSNDTNFVDTMGQILNVPIDNFAIGGAFTGPGNTGFTNINGPGLPGFPTEWQSYLAGGGPAAFPRTSGTFGPNDLVVVSIGGNDARFFELNGGTVAAAPAAAAISVGEATAGLAALVNAGARNITFLAGDVGRLPEVRGTPIAAVGTAFSSAFNQGMQGSLATMADQGVIVNYLDLNHIGDVVEANLAAFGLDSAGACPIACVTTNPELLSRYLFYVDRVHLTAAGFAIVGRYATRQLEAPLHLEAQADVGLQTIGSFGATLRGRLDLSNARFGAASDNGLHFYAVANTSSVTRSPTMTSLGYELDATGLTAGAEYDSGGGAIFGAAVNYTRSEADMNSGTGRAKANAWQAGIYGGWSGGGAFVQGHAAYGRLEYDLDRDAVIDAIDARPDGDALAAGAQAGYLFDLGGLRVGPVVGLNYAEADVDAYTEAGDPVLTLAVQEQGVQSLVGSVGIEARGTFDVGGLAVRPYAAATLEQEFDGDGRTIRYALTAAPGIVNQWVVPGRSEDLHGRLAGGVSFTLADWAALQLGATTSVGRDEGNDVAGFVGFRLGL